MLSSFLWRPHYSPQYVPTLTFSFLFFSVSFSSSHIHFPLVVEISERPQLSVLLNKKKNAGGHFTPVMYVKWSVQWKHVSSHLRKSETGTQGRAAGSYCHVLSWQSCSKMSNVLYSCIAVFCEPFFA